MLDRISYYYPHNLIGSSSSRRLVRDQFLYYYPHDLSEIELFSPVDMIKFFIIISTTAARSSSSPQSVQDQISYYYPHDHNRIKLLSSIGAGSNFLLLSPRSQEDRDLLPNRHRIIFIIIISITSVGLRASPQLAWDQISYYCPHDLNEIELLSSVSAGSNFLLLPPWPQWDWAPLPSQCRNGFHIITPMTAMGLSSSPRLAWDWISYYYPHDLNEIKILSLVSVESDFLLLSIGPQWDRAPLPSQCRIEFLIIILITSAGSSTSPRSA